MPIKTHQQQYAQYIVDMLQAWRPVEWRVMFGGVGFFIDGDMFALAVDETLYFKVSVAQQAHFKEAGSEPFTYTARGKKIRLSYWRVPEELLDDPDRLIEWAKLAYDTALNSKRKPNKKLTGQRSD